MIGAIAGDIIGSVYEADPIKTTDFPLFSKGSRFTDDTVLTAATAHAILEAMGYAEAYRMLARRYPDRGYGTSFQRWVIRDDAPAYGSYGNGAAMRVSPIGWAFDTVDRVLGEAEKSAMVTHDHPEGIKGAKATALVVFMARKGARKKAIRSKIESLFHYDLSRAVDDIRPEYGFRISCQETVPEAIIAFMDSVDFESAIRHAVSLGGDSDTLACIAGGFAEAFYGGVPDTIESESRMRLPAAIRGILDRFEGRHPCHRPRTG
jgi:ADP-ribosylglycohydrolase